MSSGLRLSVGFILILSCLKLGLADEKESIVRSITIHRENVYSDSQPEARRFPFKLANKLHLISREGIISRELLFRKGEPLDFQKAEETERNLRKLPFLTNVKITYQSNSDSADVLVHTQDLWTLSPSISASGGGGKNTFSFGIDDENFLGKGETVALYYSQDNREFFKEEWGGLFYDPFLLPARTGLLASLNKLSYGYAHFLKLNRPLYSLATPWSFRLELSNFKDRASFYQESQEVIRNKFVSQKIKANFILAKGEYRRREIKFGYGYVFDKYRPVAYSLSLDTSEFPLTQEWEKLGYLTVTLKLSHLTFVQTKNLDRYHRTEDLELGWSAEIGTGPALEILGSEEQSWRWESSVRLAPQLSEAYLFAFWSKSAAHLDDNNFFRVEHRFKLTYYNQKLPGQTLVLGIRGFDYTRQLKYRQFILGGANGLRGFEANRFSGTKAAVINLEDRFFSNLQILSFGIGGAVFMDGGQAWNRAEDIHLPKDLKWNFGIGLRLGPTKAFANRVIRLDLAKPFDSGDYFVSFGLGQIIEWGGFPED